ncbi:arabinosyltransferase domain-containing protein [Candidatus Blastococcus massiliensis]|uniref:arabinosyltransferase domain-containing protein n=1 Tax=Candidatus Blastococcus massiliensis TaxID=1470358 RepID=UPI0004B452DC|nr:arabinosyltransferase domain-containing protein [Candidatus Blastococcus massiliensis]
MSAPAPPDTPPASPTSGASSATGSGPHRRRLLPWLLAGVTLVLAVALPLAPVRVDTPEVQWPLDPSDPQSTIALFMPYRPIDLRAEIPCAAVGALAGRQEAGEPPAVLLATALPDSERGSARGLRATTTADTVRIVSSGEELYNGPLPASSDCTVVIDADQAGTSVVLEEPGSGSEVLADEPELAVPEVTAFVTDLTAADGTSPTVTAHPDARFQTSPTAVKGALVVAHVLALLGCLWLLWRAGPASHRRRREPLPALAKPPLGRGARAWTVLADVGVVTTLVFWTFVGFMNTDDYYYSVEARTIDSAGYVGNQFRFFNVPEIPFVLHQTLLAPLTELSNQPLVIRLPSLVAGLAVWWLLSRQLVPLLVDRPHPALRIVAGLALLAWWLPWNIGARPEFLITLAWAATLTLALQAIRRQRVWMLGAAAVVAGTAVTITASGLSCAATLIVLLPRLWPLLRRSALGLWATLALVVASASVASSIVFSDATLASALTALRVHREVGPVEPWYMEVMRYWYLTLGPDPAQRTFGRQLVVLLTLALLVGVSVVLTRVTRHSGGRTTWAVPALAYVAANLAFFVSPTKWTHHFGALAAPGALVLTVAVAVLVRRRPDRWASGALAVGVGLTAAIAFHAGNHQVEYSAYGVVKELPALLGNPATWALVALGSAAVVWWAWRRSPQPRPPGHRPWPEAAIGTTVVVLLASVLVQTSSASAATIRIRESWSMAKDTTSALTGNAGCGLADRAVALTTPGPLPVVAASEGSEAAGDIPDEDEGAFADLVAPDTDRWSSFRSGPVNENIELVTPWFDLDSMTDEEVLAVAVTGRPDDGTTVVAEFADAPADGSGELTPTAEVEIELDDVRPGSWAREVLGARKHHPLGTSLVRYRLTDRNFTPGGWLAMTAPYLVIGEPLSELFEGTSVALDWPIGFNMPCIEPPRIADGMVEPVDWVVFSATFADSPDLTIVDDRGGAYGTLDEVTTGTAYRGFMPGVFPYTEWGRLIELEYDLPTDAFRMESDTRTIAGWGWWPGAGPGPSPEGGSAQSEAPRN